MAEIKHAKVDLPTLVTTPFMDKYRVISIIDINELISYIILLTLDTPRPLSLVMETG